MKPGVPVFVVESVEKAVKFYTEKLAFDIEYLTIDPENKHILQYAELSKGKCRISFRMPRVEELAEFSLIKRCSLRGAGVYVVMKKGLDRYFQRCQKKKVNILTEPKIQPWGDRIFAVKDPFGIKLSFAEPVSDFQPPSKRTFLGMDVHTSDSATMEEMIRWLKGFGVLRRAGKKYAKDWLKMVLGKKK